MLMDRAGCKEIPDYLWQLPGLTEEDYKELDFEYLWKFYRNTDCFPGDDDTNYTVMGMALVKKKGINFTPSDMADFWMDNIPALRTYTAERVAYRNFTNNITNSNHVRSNYQSRLCEICYLLPTSAVLV